MADKATVAPVAPVGAEAPTKKKGGVSPLVVGAVGAGTCAIGAGATVVLLRRKAQKGKNAAQAAAFFR